MRLHPAPHLREVGYQWYASRLRAMSFCLALYSAETGWTELSQRCFKWLETIPIEVITFRIRRVRG